MWCKFRNHWALTGLATFLIATVARIASPGARGFIAGWLLGFIMPVERLHTARASLGISSCTRPGSRRRL
jgi:hypothetical protein